jgi:hypothetical protein
VPSNVGCIALEATLFRLQATYEVEKGKVI